MGIPPEKVADMMQDAAEKGLLPKKALKFAQRARELFAADKIAAEHPRKD
jgi:hypothetical protein